VGRGVNLATYVFGEIPGNPVGTTYVNRTAAMRAGVHQISMPGIAGNRHVGCVSICVNGGYSDDDDRGDEIIYTGEGGNDTATKRQTADQKLSSSGNAALLYSVTTGLPVRVIRGPKSDWAGAPTTGFRYDGLYKVVEHWGTTGLDSFWIWQFRLERLTGQDEAPFKVGVPAPNSRAKPTGNPRPTRTTGVVQRVVRNSEVARWVKELYDHTCQICGTKLAMRDTEYAEGAHIKALGHPHGGADQVGNVLCLCPNHHVLFDFGAIYLSDDLTVYDHARTRLGQLKVKPRHGIDIASVASHRERFGF